MCIKENKVNNEVDIKVSERRNCSRSGMGWIVLELT